MNLKLTRTPKYLSIAKLNGGGKKDLEIWDTVKLEFLKEMFENKAGCLLAASLFAIKDNRIGRLDSIVEINSNNQKTYLLASDQWNLAELEKIATCYQFELAELWMRPDLDSTAARKISKTDADEFWQLVDNLNTPNCNYDQLDDHIQVVGCLGDGDWIFWTNPSPEKADFILKAMKTLFANLNVQME